MAELNAELNEDIPETESLEMKTGDDTPGVLEPKRGIVIKGISDTVLNFRAEIGRRIAVRRRELGMTQSQLAGYSGLSRQALSHAEIGRGEINAGDIPLLCQALAVPVTYLFDGLNVAPIPPEQDAEAEAWQRTLEGRFNALSRRDKAVVLTVAVLLGGGEVADQFAEVLPVAASMGLPAPGAR